MTAKPSPTTPPTTPKTAPSLLEEVLELVPTGGFCTGDADGSGVGTEPEGFVGLLLGRGVGGIGAKVGCGVGLSTPMLSHTISPFIKDTTRRKINDTILITCFISLLLTYIKLLAS